MSNLRKKEIDDMKREFNKVFKFSTGEKAGSTFNLDFVKEKSKSREGLKELKDIYDSFTIKFGKELTGVEKLNDVLKYKSKAKFIETFEELFKDMAKEDQVINKDLYFEFLEKGIKLKRQNIQDNYIKFPDEATEIPEAQKEIMKGVERAKIKMVDKVQEEGESKINEEELEKITESLVQTALAQAVEEIEKKEKMKLNQEQKEVIREQIEKETEDKIKKSSEEAMKKLKEDEQKIKAFLSKMTDESSKKVIKERMIKEEMTTAKEDMAKEKDAQARAKEMRSQPKPEEEVKEEVKISMSKSEDIEDPKPTGEAIEEPLQTVGTLSDFIPPVRLVTKGKSSKDLLNDIDFFIKNFPKQLEKEKEILGRIDKSKIADVRKLHSRIVGKVRPTVDKKNSKGGEKIGVVVNADTYIREKLKEILQEQTFSNLRPADVVIDVGTKPSKESDSKDYGSFEVKSNAMGGLYAQREPIYRYLPSENDPNVGEKDLSKMEKKKTKRLELQKPKSWNIRNSTIRNYKKDPFKSKQKTNRLNYLD